MCRFSFILVASLLCWGAIGLIFLLLTTDLIMNNVTLEALNNAPAKQAWDAYAEASGGKTYDGKPLPDWEDLGEESRQLGGRRLMLCKNSICKAAWCKAINTLPYR